VAPNRDKTKEIIAGVYLGKILWYRTGTNSIFYAFEAKNAPKISSLSKDKVEEKTGRNGMSKH
jgi:hypothetical protein